MDNRCVCCGVEIPEGRQVCPSCQLNPPLLKKEGDADADGGGNQEMH